jgi:AraC-like DNA-binding protein
MRKERHIPQFVVDAVYTIKQYIEEHPLERIPVPVLISKVSIGKNLLHEAFRQVEGKTIIRFQLEKRMEKAFNLLEEGRMNVSQIAYKCGYRAQANFSSDFKKVFHMAPREKVAQNLLASFEYD